MAEKTYWYSRLEMETPEQQNARSGIVHGQLGLPAGAMGILISGKTASPPG